MNPNAELTMTTWANDLIEAYRNAAPKYRRGRIDAARLHAGDSRNTEAQRAEWTRIADTLEAL